MAESSHKETDYLSWIFDVYITGTLTQNEMIFKRLHLGTVSYGTDTMDEIQNHIINSYSQVFCACHFPYYCCKTISEPNIGF